jgi:hypothetical protein
MRPKVQRTFRGWRKKIAKFNKKKYFDILSLNDIRFQLEIDSKSKAGGEEGMIQEPPQVS